MSRLILNAARELVARCLEDGELVASALGRAMLADEEFVDQRLEDAIANGVQSAIDEDENECLELVHEVASEEAEALAKELAADMLADLAMRGRR